MARNSVWTNNDGLEVGFGTLDTDNFQGASVRTTGRVNQLVVELDWDNLPSAAGTAPSSKEFRIPANSIIQDAVLVVTDPFTSAGATTLSIGLKDSAGTVIDADGIDATIAKTAIDAIGEAVQCDGALVAGTTTIGTSDGYLSTVVATGPYTAGRGTLTVEYILPEA